MKRATFLVAAAVLAVAGSQAARADVLTWTGANNTTTNWADATKWSSDGTHTAPQAGDTAQLLVGVVNWTTLDIEGGISVGSITIDPLWGPYRIKAGWGNTPSMNFDNLGATSVVTLNNHAGSNQTTTSLVIGAEGNAMHLNLANDLLVENDPASLNPGTMTIGTHVTLTGGTAADRRMITIRQTNNRNTSLANQAASATFVGDWTIDGSLSVLSMSTDTFGDASNSVHLANGGTLNVDALSGFVWDRALYGTGTVNAPTNGFTVDTGSFNIGGSGSAVDALAVTGALTLDGGATLNVTGTIDPGDYVIVNSTGGLTGTFGTENLGSGMSLTYGENDITLHVAAVPEPATLGLLGVAGMGLLLRRRGV